jgi:hypothetical protein
MSSQSARPSARLDTADRRLAHVAADGEPFAAQARGEAEIPEADAYVSCRGAGGGRGYNEAMTTPPPLPLPVAAALEAASAGATEDFLAAFAPDGAVDDWGRVFRGHDAIRGWSDAEFIGKQVTLRVTQSRTEGDTTTVSAEVGGNGFNGPSDFAFTVQGDHVALMRITG